MKNLIFRWELNEELVKRRRPTRPQGQQVVLEGPQYSPRVALDNSLLNKKQPCPLQINSVLGAHLPHNFINQRIARDFNLKLAFCLKKLKNKKACKYYDLVNCHYRLEKDVFLLRNRVRLLEIEHKRAVRKIQEANDRAMNLAELKQKNDQIFMERLMS